MKFVKLNAFQRIMRLWDRVHPYNAVQAFRLEGTPDVQRIADAWRATLDDMGLGWAVVSGDSYCHTRPQIHDQRSQVIVAPPGTTLEQLMSNEMNAVFDEHDECPFRAFLIDDNGTYCLGVNYHHWVADSASIRWLLHEWFLRLKDPSSVRVRRAIIPAEGHWALFGPNAGKWEIDDALMSLLRYRTRFCRTRRVDKPFGDCGVAVTKYDLPDGLGPKLLKLARAYGLKFNDVCLAAIAEAIDKLGANPSTRHRDELALGTIVDLRAMSGKKMEDVFGLFLGFTTTMLRPADLRDWSRLVRTVARQNEFQKISKAPHTSVLRMGIGLAEAKLMTARRWAELYRDRMPIASGISNVNMTRDWAGKHHPAHVLDYYRVAPPGPMVPLVFTPTTLGNKMNFLITRQTSLIDEPREQKIALAVQNRLIQLTENIRS